MTPQDRRVFIETVLAEQQRRLSEAVDQMPEEWGGGELRHFIVDSVRNHMTSHGILLSAQQMEAYLKNPLVQTLYPDRLTWE